jgi:hypothetical protein
VNDLNGNRIEGPVLMARKRLKHARMLARVALLLPIPMIAGALAGFSYYQPGWFNDLFLILIVSVFSIGQVLAGRQYLLIAAGTNKVAQVLDIVTDFRQNPDLDKMYERIASDAPHGHLRDVLLSWIRLGKSGNTEGFQSLIDNAAVRRMANENHIISFHISLNRTTLKLGFLGTLIGLIQTFAPMKDAILALKDSDGEMKFVTDIAKAIDGDRYAVLTTLIATGLSLFIEMITIRILERQLGVFEQVNNYLDEWCISVLQPWVHEHYSTDARRLSMEKLGFEMEERLVEIQKKMDENLRTVSAAVITTEQHLAQMTEVQAGVASRVNKICEYEEQYRSFLGSKQNAAAGPGMIPTDSPRNAEESES